MTVSRLPIRARLTVAFATGMAVLLALGSAILYTRIAGDLLDELDTGLRSRADALLVDQSRASDLPLPGHGLVEANEAFAQVLTADGRLLAASRGVPTALLGGEQLARISRPTYYERTVRGVQDRARLLAVPSADSKVIVVVSASMSDRSDALNQLVLYLVVGGSVAILLASALGWLVAGLGLRPVELLRREASAISASGIDRRLSVPTAHDELRRLAATLNEMLERLAEAMRAERQFLDNASHELRNPLTALKAELDLARSRPRPASELESALRSASEETDRLVRLADDLLVLARAHGGRLPVHREAVSLRDVVAGATNLFKTAAEDADLRLESSAPEASCWLDPLRIRQALDNLLANAICHTPSGGRVELRADADGDFVSFTVLDTGPGFAEGMAPAERPGIGLTIVKAVAEGHGGTVTFSNGDGRGAVVTISIPARPPPQGAGRS